MVCAMKRSNRLSTFFLILGLTCTVLGTKLAPSRRSEPEAVTHPAPSTISHSEKMTAPVAAQQPATVPAIESHVVAGGGGTSSGNVKIDGTVGEAAASNTTSGGSIAVSGGFWNTVPAGNSSPSSLIEFAQTSASVTEGVTSTNVTITRTGDTSSGASIDYATANSSASERSDFTTARGTLRFAPGENCKTITLLISDDSYAEGPETFVVNLSNPNGAAVGLPATMTIQISDNPTELPGNVNDDPATYVGQHYHDFLNRQADAAGLNFWISELTSCGSDQECILAKRTNVSAAFYLSIEFQQTGYLIERLYKTAFGDASGASNLGGAHNLAVPIVRLNEFLTDTQEIGQGVVVGQPGWEQALENNKQAFTGEFVQRQRFTTALPASLTPAQFVDLLNSNANNPLSQVERDQLVSDLTGGTKTRGQVLRAVAEHPTLF